MACHTLAFAAGPSHRVRPALAGPALLSRTQGEPRNDRAALELPAHVKIPRKTIRYECVGGPRDGDLVLIQRTRQEVRLDGARYHVRLWTKMDERGQRLLWKREALVWEGLLVSDSHGDANLQPTPPQPVDWPTRDG